MVIFATPDFGAGACAAGCVLLLYLAAFGLVIGGLFWGLNLYGKDSPRIRRRGVIMMVACGLVPFFCCLGPPNAVRIMYGNYPLGSYPNNKISEGMSKDEVKAILGTPHERFTDGEEESWYYWTDSFGIGYFSVYFGSDGRVDHTGGD
jgi:hypothetical protein